MNFHPHGYQRYAIDFIKEHPVACLLLDMGLGKTVITLTAVYALLFDEFVVGKVLVVGPLRVARDTWPAEVQKWEHLKGLTYSVVIGTEKERLAAIRKKASVYIINRENVEWLVEKSGQPFNFDMVVIDELSSFKSRQAKRFRALMKVRPQVKRIVGLTGTPSSNGLMDLWSEFKLLDMGKRLGRFIGRYRDEFFVPDQRNQHMVFSYKPRPGAEKEIYNRIGDITISMRSADYLKLPECVMTEYSVELSAKERKVYDAMKRDMVADINGEEMDAMNAAALSNKLLQMASGAVYGEDRKVLSLHDQKLNALEDIVESANGRSVLVAYWFQHDAERIKQRMKVREIKSSKDIKDWNAGKIPVALIHPASAGHGLNLQAGGSMLVWFSLTWSLELYQQCNARLYRQGQTHTVTIVHIVAKDTIDGQVMHALKKKDVGQAALMDAVKVEVFR